MNQQDKDVFFTHASTHLDNTIEKIKTYLQKKQVQNTYMRQELPKVNEDDKLVQQRLIEHGEARVRELEVMIPSPYFVRCHVQFSNGKKDVLQFGKFSWGDEQIYSWITPASSMRFEAPGEITYTRPDGTEVTAVLKQKDQYLITDGNIVFLATESLDQPRELVYQEYFSKKKDGFVLPEIVAQMEKAQDNVIRAHHKGGLLISGPAGSGKTTLALHRVAYLVQSPDVSADFSPTKIIVFVQDESTKDYFSHLLPELGITGVVITTFQEWAKNVLDLKDMQYMVRIGENEKEKDMYEFTKRTVLKEYSSDNKATYNKNIFALLNSMYEQYFSDKQIKLFAIQKQTKQLDRFDLVLLLQLFYKKHGSISLMQDYYQMSKNGAAQKKRGRFPVEYSLIIFDEFQNYLGEQISLAKTTLNKKNKAVMYVGDMAQQTKLGTIRDWSEIDEDLSTDRKVMLQKVYRNTKQILEYIQTLGYSVEIPDGIKNGSPVSEYISTSQTEEITYITNILQQHKSKTIGILAKEPEYLDAFKKAYRNDDAVHCMSMGEAQGLEFDIVCLVGIDKHFFEVNYNDEMFRKEKNRMNSDLLYVALTRAIESLHVLGRVYLRSLK
jgi:DNA helicase IV